MHGGAQDRAEHRGEARGWWRRLVSPEIWVYEGGDPGQAVHWPEKVGHGALELELGQRLPEGRGLQWFLSWAWTVSPDKQALCRKARPT